MTTGHHRLDWIQRIWGSAQGRYAASRPFDARSMSFLVALFSTLPLIAFDSALLGASAEDSLNRFFATVDGLQVVTTLIACYLLQGWCIDRVLRILDPEPWLVRPWVRWLRPFLSGVPLAGLYVIPLWISLLEHKPAWAFDENRHAPEYRPTSFQDSGSPTPRFRFLKTRKLWLLSMWGQLGFLFLGLAGFFVWGEWLWHSTIPSRQLQLVCGSIALHGLGFLSMSYFMLQEARRVSVSSWQKWLFPVVACFWVVPIPLFAILPGLFIWSLIGKRMNDDSLARQALGVAGKSPRWTIMTNKLQASWQEQAWWLRLFKRRLDFDPPPVAESTGKVLLFARLKSCSLLFETAIFTHGALWLEAYSPTLSSALGVVLLFGFGSSIVLGGTATVLTGIRYAKRLFGPPGPLNESPYPRYLAIGQLSFLVGFLLGGSFYYGNAELAGVVLVLYGGVGLILGVAKPFLSAFLSASGEDSSQTRQGLLWMFGFGSILIFGIGIFNPQNENREAMMELTRLVTYASAVNLLAVNLMMVRWVLRPSNFQDIFAGDRSRRLRAKLLVLAASSVLPMGGLAVPLWFYLRRR